MNVRQRVRWGISEMMWPTAAACGLAALAHADGARRTGDPPLVAVCLWYIMAGFLGGSVLGLAKPLSRSAFGRGLVGFLVAIPVTAVVLFRSPFSDALPVNRETVLAGLGLAAVLGPFMAAYTWLRNRESGRNDHAADA